MSEPNQFHELNNQVTIAGFAVRKLQKFIQDETSAVDRQACLEKVAQIEQSLKAIIAASKQIRAQQEAPGSN